jgi:hypothetical protein
MFNRVFLFVIGIISIAWITYVGFDLLDRSDKITPQNIFDSRDGEILIVNRTKELDLNQLDFKIQSEFKVWMDTLLATPFPNERIFVSRKRPLIVVELPVIWSETVANKYFKSKNITLSKVNEDEFTIGNGIKVRFQRNFLLISKSEIEPTEESLEWPLWDKKATVSIIQLNQPLLSTDVYFKTDGTVSYQTKYSKNINSKKVDDQDLFAEVLPNKLKNYHFYEKKFALSSEVISAESPLFKWAESGYVSFEYQGKKCIVSDYLSGQDPFVVISEEMSNADTMTNASTRQYRKIQLTKSFPSNVSKGFYMMYLADKVVISESKETCQAIVADYELGKTVALTENIKNAIYQKLPKKVSERFISGNIAFAQSAYQNILIKTQIFRLMVEEQELEEVEIPKEMSWSQTIDGRVIQFLGRGNQQYIWTSAGKLVSISNKQLRWKINVEGTLISDPQFIEWQGNVANVILFNTDSKIYLINESGQNIAGFPFQVDNNATNGATFFKSKNGGNLVVMDEREQLLHIDSRGKLINSLKMKVGNVKNPVDVFMQKGNLIAVVAGSAKTQTVNLQKHKIVKAHESMPQDRISVSSENGPNYFAVQNGSLKKMDYTGKETVLANYPNAKQFRLIEGKNFSYLAFISYNKIHVLNQQGVKLFQFDIPFKELASYDVITLQNGKTFVAMIDAIENNLFVLDRSGRNYTPKPLEGKEQVILSEKGNNNLVVTTSGSGFVVQYFDVLKQGSSASGQEE